MKELKHLVEALNKAVKNVVPPNTDYMTISNVTVIVPELDYKIRHVVVRLNDVTYTIKSEKGMLD